MVTVSCGAREHRPELDDEIECHQQRPQRERHVADKAPPLPQYRRVVEIETACIGEIVFIDRVELRPADRKEIERDP